MARKRGLACSFCGRSADQVASLVAGPGVYICDGCVGLCNEVLVAELGDYPGAERIGPAASVPTRQIPTWDAMTVDELLERLPRLADVQRQAEDSLKAGVARLRALGVTWQRIGDAFGMTRQSAWERFSGEE